MVEGAARGSVGHRIKGNRWSSHHEPSASCVWGPMRDKRRHGRGVEAHGFPHAEVEDHSQGSTYEVVTAALAHLLRAGPAVGNGLQAKATAALLADPFYCLLSHFE